MSKYITPRKKQINESTVQNLSRRIEENIEFWQACNNKSLTATFEEILKFINNNQNDQHKKFLLEFASLAENESEKATSQFNKGFFNGKEEAFKLAESCLNYTEVYDIIDSLQGDR